MQRFEVGGTGNEGVVTGLFHDVDEGLAGLGEGGGGGATGFRDEAAGAADQFGIAEERKVDVEDLGLGRAESFAGRLEPHDSFFIGSDVFVTFLVSNGWWSHWTAHKQGADAPGGNIAAAQLLHGLIPTGGFPRALREDFLQLLEHFGQAPIIVRSSSLLEDDFGNAFAGKYASVFCVNQGTPTERLAALEDAIRSVYASAVGPEALQYRADRGLLDLDEQMAILVQRVSGDLHEVVRAFSNCRPSA